MGYTLTPNSVARVRRYLDELVIANSDVSWDTSDPSLAYHIREGIAAAAHLKLESYGGLSAKFIIRSSPSKVTAELRNKLELDKLRESLAAPANKITVRDAISLLEIIGAVVKHNADEMYFPLASLEDGELTKLQRFAASKEYEVLDHEEEGITLRRIT